LSAVGEVLAGLSPLGRRVALGLACLVVLALLAGGVWAFLERRETAAERRFALLATTYRAAVAGGDEASVARAAEEFKGFLNDHPRSAGAGEAWYLLGNLEYRRKAWDAAISAYDAARRRGRGTVASLATLGSAYAHEAKGDAAGALEAYREARKGRDPKEYLYGELLLAEARVQEALRQAPGAVETYRQYLREVPGAPRGDEVRGRLAILGAPTG
jgi:tetratricopeptide (TPR) repeat protein